MLSAGIRWKGPPPDSFDGVDCVFHLAGESVAERWTTAQKARIRDSRYLEQKILFQVLKNKTSVKKLVSVVPLAITVIEVKKI